MCVTLLNFKFYIHVCLSYKELSHTIGYRIPITDTEQPPNGQKMQKITIKTPNQ